VYKVIIVVKQDINGTKTKKADVSLCGEVEYLEEARRLVNAALSVAGVPSKEDDSE
jgi:osmotically-inducible protein OsmY